ncbi:nucleoside 2-deoxyribosyltransferase [Mesoplasma seiffertii]|uniref:nucleoside 2-deoxyribosyltransferase n=1 Tax=Mesoplasma seiffertii TaxID=28224 RepID=UPI00047ED4CA|nr:nucleoside 2-deoxyribosyltransferase [Mesoplasma seiffertii]
MRNNQKVIYNAGSMFTEAQWDARKAEGAALKEMFPDFWIGNPVDFDTNQTERPTNKAIFEMDFEGLTDADYVILEIDGWDSGTHMEFGLVVQQAIANKQKYLFPIISDFRFKQGILRGEIPGLGINEMITGAFYYDALNQGEVPQLIVCDSHKTAREAIKAIETGDTKNYRERFDIKDLYAEDSIYHGFKK